MDRRRILLRAKTLTRRSHERYHQKAQGAHHQHKDEAHAQCMVADSRGCPLRPTDKVRLGIGGDARRRGDRPDNRGAGRHHHALAHICHSVLEDALRTGAAAIMDLGNLVRPFLNVLGREISATIDTKALAKEVLVVLAERTDEEWASAFDRIVKGGKIAEAIDYGIGLSYIKKLRAWCAMQTMKEDLK